MTAEPATELESFVAARSSALFGTAVLLTGDRHVAAAYGVQAAGAQPWGPRGRAIELSVGQRVAALPVLAGVVGGGPRGLAVRASFDVYVDGRLFRHYEHARLSLVELGPGGTRPGWSPAASRSPGPRSSSAG